MSSEKLSKLRHPELYSAFKSCKKPSFNRLTLSTSKLNAINSFDKTAQSRGAVNEEHFMKAFDVTYNKHFPSEEIDDVLKEIKNNICTSENWEKRVEAMKNLRTVIASFRGKYDGVLERINLLDVPLESSLKDLKSQVIREACITIAFLSMNLQHKFDHFAEVVFSALMLLIQSSVKVISSSGATCIRFVLRNTHNARLLSVLAHHMNSKSAPVRCAVCEFVELILYHWKTKFLERHINLLKATIRLGISDANPDARAFSRQAFWHFVHHFPGHEKMFLDSLDVSCKRFLYIGVTRSPSSLTNFKSLSGLGQGRSAYSKPLTPKEQNHDVNKINQVEGDHFDLTELRKKEQRLTYSDVTKEIYYESKEQQLVLPKSKTIVNHVINSHSGTANETSASKHSKVLISSKIKNQNTDIKSSNSGQLTVNIQPCNEKCTDSNNENHQEQCGSNMKSTMNDEVGKMIMNLSGTSLKNKVEGLVDLQIFFQTGNTLNIHDLSLVTDIITNILEEDCTDFFGLFLDTLSELLVCHKKDLNYWLDRLLTNVLNKFNTQMPKHFENRLARVLESIKGSFPIEVQLLSLLRFFKENAQAENINAIAVALNYIYILMCNINLGSDLPTTYLKNENNIIISILTKLSSLTVNENTLTNQSEVQKAAKEALVKLYSLNVPEIKLSFSLMPVEYQKVIQNLISGGVNNTITNGDNNSSLPTLNIKKNTESHFANNSCENNSSSSDKVVKQPQVITTDIIDFGCDLCKEDQQNHITTAKSLTNKINTQMKCEQNLKEVNNKSKFCLNNETQYSIMNNKMHSDPHYFDVHCRSTCVLFSSNDATDQENEKMVLTVLKSLNTKMEHEADKCTSLSDKMSALDQLMRLSGELSSFIIGKHFKLLLRTLFDYMSETDTMFSVLALEIATKMLNRNDMTEKFNNYTELLIFQILLLCTDKNKQIAEKAVLCLNTIAVTLDSDTVIKISVPLAVTSEFPANVAAINVITTLVKRKGREPIEVYVPELMPILIQSLGSIEILLRKSALFCMVALYLTVGKESIMHYISTLDHGKLKLLMMYVQKAKESEHYFKT